MGRNHNGHDPKVAVWHSGNGVGRINQVTLRRHRLVLKQVTASLHGYTISVCTQPPRPTQPPTLSGIGNDYQPNGCEDLQLGSNNGR